MDSESLDRCIQTALSSLYPPFQATSPTVLCQVLSVVESRYRGDGLRYLIHFLLPAKQFLQNIQQDACLQYCGLLFLHEGWPLCVHERVVVQLCPLDHRLLRPGDFYLLVSPPPSPIPPRAHSASCKSGVTSSPRLLVCSVSAGSHHVEQQEVSELALRSLFSMAWLDSVNREREQRGASRLERCLLSAHGDVFRVPWEDLVYPQFISRPRTTLGEDKESSVKDGDMFINTSHDPCRDTNSPGQDVKLLPSSAKTDQSAASSESEDSEGEYVELTELPLPRFSPQKGSLTQSISLQHRARSSTHPSTHTHIHSAATHTPQNTHTLSAAAHTPQNTHTLSASTHTPKTPLTHPANTTHSWSCVEVSSQTGLCSRLIEENLSQDSCGPVILTPVSPAAASSSSSAPPEVVGTSSCQSERQMSQKEIEGTDSTSPNLCTEPENCTEQREEEEEEERKERELRERQERKNEMKVLADEVVEKEEEKVQEERMGQSECRRDESLLLDKHAAAQGGEMEEEDEEESEETEGELEEERVEEVEVEEEVQVIIVQKSQESREEQHVMVGGGHEAEEEEEERGGEQILTDEGAQSHTNTQCEDNAPHTHTEPNTQHTHTEPNTQHTHTEDNTPHTHTEEDNTQPTHTDESNTPHTHTEDNTPHTHTEYFTQHTHTEDNTQHTHTEDNTQPTHTEDNTQHTHTEDNTPHTHTEDNTPHTHTDESNTPHTHTEDNTPHTHTDESNTQHTHTEDNTQPTHTEDNTPHTHTEDNTPHTHTDESNTRHTHTDESNTPHTHTDESNTQHTHTEDNTQPTHTEDNTPHTHTEDNTPHTHTDESNTPHTHTEDNTPHTHTEYFTQHTHTEDNTHTEEENTPHTHTDESNTRHTHTEDYTQHTHTDSNTPHTHTEEDNTPHTHTEEDNTPHTHTEEDNTPHTHTESNIQQTHTEDNTPHTHTEEDNTPHTHTEEDNTQHTHTEDNTPHTHTEEDNTPHTHTEEDNTQHTHTEDNTPHTHTEDNTQHTHTEDYTPLSVSTPALDAGSCWDELQESENGHNEEEDKEEEEEEQEEEEEECCCEEVGGGRAAELQNEGSSSETPPVQSDMSLFTGPSPAEPEQPADQSAAPTVPVQLTQSSQSSFNSVLLRSGVLCLPGTRDRGGRALLTVCTTNAVWSNPDCDSAELLRLLLYYTSTLRKDVRAQGLTVLVDARRAAPVPALFSALEALQDNIPGSIHTVLLLVNKDSSLRLDKPAATQVEVLSSLKSVQKHVELRQLPAEFGGSFSFSQSSWLCFRSRLEQLTNQCEDVINLLQKTINILQSTPLPAAAEEAELLLSRYQAVMRSILEDSRLVQLQQEGGASLSRLRREESSISVTEDYRAAVETVSSLYEQVDELLHRLVTLSNARTQELQFIAEFRNLEQGFSEVRSWLEEVGEVRLKNLDESEDSLELLNKKQQDFKEFYTTAYDRCKHGEALLSRLERWEDVTSADLHHYEVKVHSFWAQLQDFSQRVKTTGHNIDRAVRLYSFLDQAYGWALEGMRHLAGISMEDCTLPDKCQAVIGCLEDYHRQHPPIPDAHFQEMKAAAGELRGERGLRQWSFAWSKCQETKKMFDRKMEAALRTRDSAHRRRSDSTQSRSSASLSRKTLSGLWGGRETSSSPPEDSVTSSPTSSSSLLTPQHTPLLQRLFRSVSSDEASDRVDLCSSSPSLPRLNSSASLAPSSPCSSSSSCSSFSSSRRQQLRKTQSFDCPSTPEVSRYGPCPRALSEPVRRGNTGVFIRGLEVSSSEAADHTLCPRTAAHGWAGQGLRSPGTPGTPRTTGSPAADPRPRGSKLRHIVEEMVTTEREYVRSLRYIIHHYFPEMDRADLPQDLRGKRSVVFGNLEKLLDFHSQFFLRELEACWKHPLRAPHCFLRHQEQFSLYALYSKNKPKSDSLLANHGHSFFRRKQVELGDKMDLSSYLLKPVQRMSKYALLLTDLMKEVGVAQEAELVALQAATNMVKFQLRHGNDLLAMDAIRNCDVNLKEQGQLIRQDEFTVWTGRRKCQRHVFLFEELVLFSKPKKMEGGLDVFIYKHSFKTADVGLTESTGDNGLRFEIWFRRRTTKNQTFILQAAAADIKHAWTSDIARILWTQATRNKEMRLKEMVSMGVGNKPFLDIQPSDAAISDRAVHYIMKSRGARTRASIAVSVFDHSNPFKRGTVTSDPSSSGPSSSSLLGPLNLHMYSQALPSSSSSSAAEGSFITSCIEEDEQEHETGSQPSMTTESSDSSSRCLSGSTGSDSGCVSSHLQEALPEESGPPGQPSCSSSSSSSSNKQHLNSQYISPKASPVIGPATIV